MFAPIILKTKSKFGYIQLTEENIGKLYDKGYITSSESKSALLNRVKAKPHMPIKTFGHTGVFPNHFLVFQFDQENNVTGCISFETKEEMCEFFQEASGNDILPD